MIPLTLLRYPRALIGAAAAFTAFSLGPALHSQPADWTSATTGNWSNAALWTPAVVPNSATADATIGATGAAYTVTLNQNVTVDTLTLGSANATFRHDPKGTLTDNLSLLAGTYLLNGTIKGGTITRAGGALQFGGSGLGTLDGATLAGDLNVGIGGALTLRNGATFTGASANLDRSATLTFASSTTLAGKTITLAEFSHVGAGAVLTLDATTSITGEGGFTGALINHGAFTKTGLSSSAITGTFTNHGTVTGSGGNLSLGGGGTWTYITTNAATGVITANGSGHVFFGSGAGVTATNLGLISADGGLVTLGSGGSAWTNTGTLRAVNGGTLSFAGNFTTAALQTGTVEAVGGSVQITGSLNNAGATLVAPATGRFTLNGGTINGGTIDPSALQFSSDGILDAVTYAGALSLTASTALTARNNAIFQGDLTLASGAWLGLQSGATFTGASVSLGAGTSLRFTGTPTLTGKTITFAPSAIIYVAAPWTTTTFGPTTTLTGAVNLSACASQTKFVNQGTITTTGGSIYGGGQTNFAFINEGTVTSSGGTFDVSRGGNDTITNAASGTMTADAGSVIRSRITTGIINHGTLAGGGTFSGKFVVTAGGKISPGSASAPGTLTFGAPYFGANLTLRDGAVLNYELGTMSDLIVMAGTTFLSGPGDDGSITVNLADSGGFAGGAYTLIDYTGATLSGLSASSFALGTTIAGYEFAFSDTGSAFVLLATSTIPEPSTWAALAGLGALGLAAWSRRSRRARSVCTARV